MTWYGLLALSPHDLHLFLLLGFSSTHVTNKSEDNQPVPRVKKRNGSILLGEAGQPASHAAAALQYLSRSGREKSPGARVTEAVEYLELQRTRARAAIRWETMTSLHDSLVETVSLVQRSTLHAAARGDQSRERPSEQPRVSRTTKAAEQQGAPSWPAAASPR